MKKVLMILPVIILISCLSNDNAAENKDLLDDTEIDYFLKPLDDKQIVYLHLALKKELTKGSHVYKGELLGFPEPIVGKYSDKNHSIIQEAKDLYYRQDFSAAYNLLEKIEAEEKENLFFLYYYAKTLYKMNNENLRKFSFDKFKKMVEIIDKSNYIDPNTVVVDLWFTDVYLLLGELYLEYKDYDKAIFEIAKYIYIIPYIKRLKYSYEQVLNYLTEAYYFKNNYIMNYYFYKKTLNEFPENGYVLNFKL